MKEKKEAMLSFRVTLEEKQRLKVLAEKERRTIKQLFLAALDKTFPDWEKDDNIK